MIESRYDVVIVGGGFAGSLVAKTLGERGWRILVLEAGTGTEDTWQDHQDALRTFRTAVAKTPTAPYRTTAAAPSPDVLDLTGGPDGFVADGYLIQRGPLPYSSPYLRVNGGSGNAWTGLAPRMHPEDFRAADLGPGRNWPIGYAELEPWYREAEREIGVAADVDEQHEGVGLPFPPDYQFPMHGMPRSFLDEMVSEAVDGRRVHDPFLERPTELRVVGTPQARNAPPNARYDGGKGFRPDGHRCVGYASCVPICPEDAKYTPLKTQARWPANVTLRTRAVVNRLTAEPDGRITGVTFQSYADGSGRHTVESVEAETVVLAAHAIENAKLLLMCGLADRSGQVGRNLMDHPALITQGLTPVPCGPYRGPGSTAGIEAFRFGPGRRVRAPFRIEIGNWGWVWALGPPDLDTAWFLDRGVFGRALREGLADRVGRQFALQFEIEQEADPANRVTLDPHLRDVLGNPRPVLDYSLSDHVKRGMLAAKRVSDQIFELLGAEDHTAFRPEAGMPGYVEYGGEPLGYRGAGHGGGTHLMGDAPHDSVVNQWQQCWDHPNLYLVGCGSMPSLGTSNPSLTMAALALRSAEHMDRELQAARRITVKETALSLPPVAAPFQLPFHYGALHQVGIDHLVDPEPARKLLARLHPGLQVAEFDGKACVSTNFQLYFAQYADGGGVTQEIEISVIALPIGQEHRVSTLSYDDYASGTDSSKLLGIGRLHVLCDNPIAIEAGTKLFAEPKYPARFEVEMPSLNGPDTGTWNVRCLTENGDEMLSLTARLDNLPAVPVNSAPVTGYGTTPEGRLLAGPMNVYQPYRLHRLDAATANRVSVTVTDPTSPVGADLTALLGSTPAAGAWTYQSAPVAAHNRPYYVP